MSVVRRTTSALASGARMNSANISVNQPEHDEHQHAGVIGFAGGERQRNASYQSDRRYQQARDQQQIDDHGSTSRGQRLIVDDQALTEWGCWQGDGTPRQQDAPEVGARRV